MGYLKDDCQGNKFRVSEGDSGHTGAPWRGGCGPGSTILGTRAVHWKQQREKERLRMNESTLIWRTGRGE